LAVVLTVHGFRAITAYSGEEAIRKASEEQPWIVLSDVVMPKMSGIEAGIRIRRRHPTCEVVLFSGWAGAADLLNIARRFGFDFEIIASPIHPQYLLERLRRQRHP
jgi:DNA-binding NtrC family response regulator